MVAVLKVLLEMFTVIYILLYNRSSLSINTFCIYWGGITYVKIDIKNKKQREVIVGGITNNGLGQSLHI